MKRTFTTTATLALSLAAALAQGPNKSGDYYLEADGLKGAELKTKLFTIISKKTNKLSYDDLLEKYMDTDTRADGKVRDWYSNITNYTHIKDKAGTYSKEGDCYNREHTIPSSWGAPEADIVHVVPTDGYVNNRRSNYPFGETDGDVYKSANGYSKLGACKTAGYSGRVFEPNDEVKGDIARIYFYMATCYESTITSWSGGGVITGTKYQPYAQWTFDMMMRWAKLDPVDDVETARNNAVAKTDVQGNRNPFVDYPGLEDYIWGSKKDAAFSYNHYEGSTYEQPDMPDTPVFEPAGGTFTNQVVVTISTATDGATIYYTTNGTDASENSRRYTAPFTLTESATVKAIAVKDGVKSYQATATFTVSDGQGQQTPDESTIALNNALFGTSYEGSILKADADDLVGTKNGVTVVYALGDGGSNRYCNDSQIRLYQKNTLTISVADGELTELEFQLAQSTQKKLQATVGSVSDYTWTGRARSVTFSVDDGSGHARLTAVKVAKTSTDTAISSTADDSTADSGSFHSLSGLRVDGHQLRPGIYIHRGKKVVVK